MKRSPQDQFLIDCLSTQDFIPGSELSKVLQAKFPPMSDQAARQCIKRAAFKGYIHSTSPVTFGKRQFVYLLNNERLNDGTILKMAEKLRPALYRLIKILYINDGIISWYEALKIAAAPLQDGKTKQDSLDKLVKELQQLKIATITTDKSGIRYLITNTAERNVQDLQVRHRVRMQVDAMFVLDILNSLNRINLIDNVQYLYRNKVIPSKGVEHNNFVWDAIAYTKTTGIDVTRSPKTPRIEKQTMVVFDVVVSRPYTDHDLQGFYSRVQVMLNGTKEGTRKVMPIIVYSEFDSPITRNKIRKLGFLAFGLGMIYGEKIYDVLMNLKLIKLAEAAPSHDESVFAQQIDSALSSIRDSGQDGNLKNIKGDLFESLMYPVLANVFPMCAIDSGKIHSDGIGDERKSFEYDHIVHLQQRGEKVVVEVKGFKSTTSIPLGDNMTKNTVDWFFRNTFPFIKKIFEKNSTKPKVHACFITTASFRPEALAALEHYNNSQSLKSPFLDVWYDGPKLLDLLDRLQLNHIKKTVKRYYIEDENQSEDVNRDVLTLPPYNQRNVVDGALAKDNNEDFWNGFNKYLPSHNGPDELPF